MKPTLEDLVTPPKFSVLKSKTLFPAIILIIIFSLTLPWYSFTSGMGKVTALDPNERIQEINSPINGFVSRWYVYEGAQVKKGDVMLEMVDADPELLSRIEREKEAAESALKSAKLVLSTAELNLNRQTQLLRDG